MTRTFSLTYDYLCPFARNANETVVGMLQNGAQYEVTFIPFSLQENHAQDGDVPEWGLPIDEVGSGVLALLWSIAVRDSVPESFLNFHIALFASRHDDAADINDEAVLQSVAESVGLDSDVVRAEVASGTPAKTLAAEHTSVVRDHHVFGVPTFIQDDDAVFVRIMNRHNTADLEKVLEMLSWTNLNEFKRTTIDR